MAISLGPELEETKLESVVPAGGSFSAAPETIAPADAGGGRRRTASMSMTADS